MTNIYFGFNDLLNIFDKLTLRTQFSSKKHSDRCPVADVKADLAIMFEMIHWQILANSNYLKAEITYLRLILSI